MVYFSSDSLDRTFAALADPTRRALLARLSETDSISVSELAKPFPISLPAVMKHLDVLSKDLRVMDASAISLMRENAIPVVVFSIKARGNLLNVLSGTGVFTTIGEPAV